LFERCDAFRKPQRFIDMLTASECDHRGRTGFETRPFPQKDYLQTLLIAAQTVKGGDVAEIARQRYPQQPQRIPEAIHDARVKAVADIVSAAQSTPGEAH
jgi:tRNA nucleotidyltransferase (CCA-adding enzyme)